MDRAAAFQAIEAGISDIARNGTLNYRNDPGHRSGFSLRFRVTCPETGARKQRRIDLGDDAELIEFVRQAVACRKRRRAEAREADAERAERSKRRRTMERELMTRTEGSRRYQQAVRKAFRDYCAIFPQASVQEFLDVRDIRDLRRRRHGRPYASRLW